PFTPRTSARNGFSKSYPRSLLLMRARGTRASTSATFTCAWNTKPRRPERERLLGSLHHLALNEIERVTDRLAGFGFVIVDMDVQRLLEAHDKLDHVERVGAEVR